jgi:plastocyanin
MGGCRRNRKLVAGVSGLTLAVAGAAGAGAAGSAAPSKVTVKESYSIKMVANRYIQDGMRFDKDVYTVKSGGTVKLLMNAPQEGPHTLTVVAPRDLPKTAEQAFNHCSVCEKLAKAHGAEPQSEAPPKFLFLENGVGQNTAPVLDRPGDSGIVSPPKGPSVSFKVGAKKGTTLSFMCIIHPWMQGKIKVQ